VLERIEGEEERSNKVLLSDFDDCFREKNNLKTNKNKKVTRERENLML
jgi:hypothetical protein